jgi:hypothetical protein
MAVSFTLNGKTVNFDGDPETPHTVGLARSFRCD